MSDEHPLRAITDFNVMQYMVVEGYKMHVNNSTNELLNSTRKLIFPHSSLWHMNKKCLSPQKTIPKSLIKAKIKEINTNTINKLNTNAFAEWLTIGQVIPELLYFPSFSSRENLKKIRESSFSNQISRMSPFPLVSSYSAYVVTMPS